jgi:hypothetical protein
MTFDVTANERKLSLPQDVLLNAEGPSLFLFPDMGDDAWRTVTIAASLLSPLQ